MGSSTLRLPLWMALDPDHGRGRRFQRHLRAAVLVQVWGGTGPGLVYITHTALTGLLYDHGITTVDMFQTLAGDLMP